MKSHQRIERPQVMRSFFYQKAVIPFLRGPQGYHAIDLVAVAAVGCELRRAYNSSAHPAPRGNYRTCKYRFN